MLSSKAAIAQANISPALIDETFMGIYMLQFNVDIQFIISIYLPVISINHINLSYSSIICIYHMYPFIKSINHHIHHAYLSYPSIISIHYIYHIYLIYFSIYSSIYLSFIRQCDFLQFRCCLPC